MSMFKKLYAKAETYFLKNADFRKVFVEAALRRGDDNNRISGRLQYSAKNLRSQTLKVWKNAVAAASDPENPDYSLLAELYYNLLLDNHLSSVIDTLILFVQRSAFKMVSDSGEENKDVSKLFERPWFFDLMRKYLFSKFQGRTLLEIYDLNEDGELMGVEEIPQTHFNPLKGIIIEKPGDTKGWNYKEGAFADQYVQIGKDYDLGMLEMLAPIILAKKLAMGSYQDYIEKYGVPPLFITTDREDKGRLDELFEAASNFKSNQFMIGRGQEKFEIGKDMGGGGTAPFATLINIVNDEISKKILGGAGITDEKAFVGSAEIQFRLTKDRYESLKLSFKYFFNSEIRPKLIKLSPIYAPLANHSFEWDNTESLNQKEIIEAISKLGNVFEFDAEEVATILGLPIIGTKTFAPVSGGDTGKKQ